MRVKPERGSSVMDTNNDDCYTLQLKYVFWLEENVSRAMGQNSLTP